MQHLATALALSALVVLSSACATTRAQTQEPRPPLEVPPVPPRVVEAVPPPQTPQLEPVGELPTTPTSPPVRPRPPTREPTQRDAKPEAKTAEPVPEPTTSAATQPTSPVPPLRTARTADGAQAERQIRDIIYRANALLARVDYRKLSAERRKAYDQAKQFIETAEAAIRDSKFEFGLEVADKAETLAKELQS
jgi:outer membrane biosynthesis protein TonB